MSIALHYSARMTRASQILADNYAQINKARKELDALTHDGLVLHAAADAVAETDPTLALAKLDTLIDAAMAMQRAIEDTLAEFEGDEAETAVEAEVEADEKGKGKK